MSFSSLCFGHFRPNICFSASGSKRFEIHNVPDQSSPLKKVHLSTLYPTRPTRIDYFVVRKKNKGSNTYLITSF
ncbi:hypothetical protein HanLR1_Chr02g0073351 [Helianthus annuus]|nr:hypothetical protein HanLR1_Chr02g0073351 [Helianthus annuus]